MLHDMETEDQKLADDIDATQGKSEPVRVVRPLGRLDSSLFKNPKLKDALLSAMKENEKQAESGGGGAADSAEAGAGVMKVVKPVAKLDSNLLKNASLKNVLLSAINKSKSESSSSSYLTPVLNLV